MVAKDDETSKDKEIDKLMALISLSFKKSTILPTTTFELHQTPVEQIRIILQGLTEALGIIIKARECQKPKWVKDAAYHREKMLLCKQEEAGIQLNAEQADWRDDADNDDDNDLANERELFASLIKKLKCEIDDNKNEKWMDESIPWDQKCKTSKELFKIKRSVGTIFDGVKCCKETIAKQTYFGHIDPFIQNTIEANFSPEIQKINADLENFHACLQEEMVDDLRYFNSLELEVDSLKSQLETQKTQFLNEIDRLSREYYYAHHMNDLKAQLQKKCIVISELNKLIAKLKGKSVDTKFEKSSVIRQPNAFKSQRPSILGKPTIFSDSLERKDFSKSNSVTKNNVSNDFSKPVTAQILPPFKKSILKNTNVLALEMYKLHTEPTQARASQLPQDSRKTNKRVSFSTGVIPATSVSRPQLKSNLMEDRVLLNNSKGKKQEVEDKHRNVKLSKNKTSVTACNDSLNAKTLNLNFVCATCESNQKPRNITRKLYEHVSKNYSWWYPKFTPPGYKWKPMSKKENVNPNVSMPLGTVSRTANILEIRLLGVTLYQILHCLLILLQLVEIVLFVIDSGCSKHMTGNLKLLINFVEKFLGTVKFGNDQITPILGYGDLVQGAVTIKRVYYVEGLNHNLFSVGQFYDADLEVAFRKSTCYICDLKGNDLLTGSRGTDLYSITLQDTNSPNPICLMSKATSSQAWSKDETPVVLIDFLRLVERGLHAQVRIVRTNKCTEFLNKTLHAYFASKGILHQTSVSRTPEQNGVVERRNRTLVEAA
nr:integrase, catalytic region, zinc finger, CCHC-type, peptidase aspartic, catalytic [Tanacetum cinerariifolium]